VILPPALAPSYLGPRSDPHFLAELTGEVHAMTQHLQPGRRFLVGVTGAPASGKSTLAADLAHALGPRAAFVPMDGFHLSNEVLLSHGLLDVKGAPETFDALGYLHLLKRLQDREQLVYAPRFVREVEESFAGSLEVTPEVDVVVTEGNYLLLDAPHWEDVRTLLDLRWYLDLPEHERLERLVTRHEAFGRTREQALERAHGSDQRNSDLITTTRDHADRVLRAPTTTVVTCSAPPDPGPDPGPDPYDPLPRTEET
jgi:pantothenate kinase